MHQDHLKKLANQFMAGAVRVQAGDHIWAEYQGEVGKPIAEECCEAVARLGGTPHIIDTGAIEIRKLLDSVQQASDPQAMIADLARQNLRTMQSMQGYIRICDFADSQRAHLTPEDSMLYRGEIMHEATQYRVKHTKWLVVTAPGPEFAQACQMTMDTFNQFYLDACLTDYQKMGEAAEYLTALLKQSDHVVLTGQDTHIEFSIKDIGAKTCAGSLNIPDGECFSAPVRNSVNGKIRYEKSVYMGVEFPWVSFECRDGRIENAQSADDDLTQKLNTILDKDEGARYFGEFAIGFHPSILHPVGNILFDEKIAGSFHLTPGQCYTDWADNGNASAIHWDLVKIQRPDYGGGDIIIDDKLIRRDGLFIPDDVQSLNPENLK